MKRFFSPKNLIIFSTAAVFLVSSTSALAYFERDRVLGEATPSSRQRGEEHEKKLSEVKLKICKKRQDIIKKRSIKLAERAQKMITRFANHAQRVEDYYTNILLPKGKVVENYDQLVTNIINKKILVEEAVENAKNAASAFDCSSDDPKGQLTTFRLKMQETIKALKNYKKAVRDLIVAVRTVNKQEAATSSAH
jgi:vacuolar-type H+-ATPase subunit H